MNPILGQGMSGTRLSSPDIYVGILLLRVSPAYPLVLREDQPHRPATVDAQREPMVSFPSNRSFGGSDFVWTFLSSRRNSTQ
jgi:hypothetical protein